jgi:FkbM family methyltransferase
VRPSYIERRIAAVGLGPSDVAIDCGANVGHVTLELARFGAEIHAFEPNPDAFGALERRAGALPNVHVHPVAVLDRDGPVRLYLHKRTSEDPLRWSAAASLLPFKWNVDVENYVVVEAIDLSRFILKLDRPVKFVKIDVEGVEHAILHRLIDSGAIERIETMFVEIHDPHVPELREKTALLRNRLHEEGLEGKVRTDWT